MTRWPLIAVLALAGCKDTFGGGGTAVGNPARTFIRPPIPVATGTASDARFEVLRCDGTTETSDTVDADLVTGDGPELPGGELCAIQFRHGAITGDLQAPEGLAGLATPPFTVNEGAFVLELGEDGLSDDSAGLYAEIVEDGLLDPIERSFGAVAYGADRQDVAPRTASAMMLVGLGGARIQRTGTGFPDYPVEPDDIQIDLADVVYGDGLWVAVGGDGYGGISAVSADGGFTWTRYTHTNPLSGVAFHDGVFAASSLMGTIEVFDGATWSPANAPMIGYKSIESGDNGLLALAGTDVAISTNGIDFDVVPLPGVAGFGVQAAAHGNGVWVAVGDLGYRVRSLDGGLTWQDETSGGNTLTAIAFDGAEFMAVGVSESWESPDGVAWAAGPFQDLHDVAPFRDGLVALDEAGTVYERVGATWEPLLEPPGGVWMRFGISEP